MTDKLRIKIATVVTALFLAAVSVAGALTHGTQLPSATTVQARPLASGQSHIATHPTPTRHDQEHD